MAISVLDLSERAELGRCASLVEAIHSAAPGVQPLLVGAMARDIQFGHARNIWAPRNTHDIDFAFCLDGWDAFEALRSALLQSGRFRESRRARHELFHAGTTRVDIIPFGGLERPDRTVLWPPDDDTRMNLVGYREVSMRPTRVMLPAGQEAAGVSIPGFALLKLFAWRDRKGGRDAGDIRFVLENYLEVGGPDRLYTEAAHLLDSQDFDYAAAGAWLLGKDIAELVALSAGSDALDQAFELLDRQLDEDGPLRLVAEMGDYPDRNFRALASLREGLRQPLTEG